MTQVRINLLGQNFATMKAVAPFSNIQSFWPDKYGSIDTSNINIGPLELELEHLDTVV